ncbi:MAG: 50S ribosomal protein L9 [Elusimicrobiota bacterium]
MKVILKTDVENLGRAGDVKDVALGFARNYLITRGLAMEATPAAIQWFAKGEERRKKIREKALAAAKGVCEQLASVKLSFSRKVGENGKLFGSVGKSDILKSLKASGHDLDRDAVCLAAPLKEVGDFDVELRLASEASVKIKISVVARQ